MPNAAALEWQPHPSWITEPLLATGKDATRTRDSGEILARGPQTIALALHRAGKDAGREQRVILVGDGDFVSNTYLGNGDNQALATQWVDWLTGNDGLLGIETRLAPDVALDFTPWQQAALALGPDWDIEIAELHHRLKVDAPSGTALLLGEAAASGRGIDLKQHSDRGRDGITGARKAGDIGFASLRGGSVAGDHHVIFASEYERIELVHRAETRAIFARGAVKAATWLTRQKAGRFTMQEVLGL